MLKGRWWASSSAKYRHGVVALAIAWWLAGTLVVAEAYNFHDCEGCHESLLEEAQRGSLHGPFREKACAQCHAAGIAEKYTASELKEQQKINWFGESVKPFAEHVFLLPGSKAREFVIVDVKNNDGTFRRHELTVPRLADLAEVENSGEEPVLSGLQVFQVNSGVILSATIGWQTNTITDALVHYGEQALSQSAETGQRLGREHRVILQNLRPNRTYRFTATSRDLFGRSRVSEAVGFSTAEPYMAPSTEYTSQAQAAAASEFGHVFKRHNDDYLLELTLGSPAGVYVGSKGRVRGEGLPDDEFHEGLSGKSVISLNVCINCHTPHLHPLNVMPTKPGVTIPKEFPVLKGGRITCASCHDPHGSGFAYQLRKANMQELCASCHPKWVKEK